MDKIAILYDDYEDILKEFGEDKIQSRFQDLYEAYTEFIKNNHIEGLVKINSYTLMHAVLDYFTDISRLKSFHKIKRTNSFKVIAYEISWLLRRKPLQILKDQMEELIYMNEKFVLSYTLSFLTESLDENFYLNLDEKNKKIFDGFIDSFYYFLKFRNCNSQSLEFALLCFRAGIAAAGYEIPEE